LNKSADTSVLVPDSYIGCMRKVPSVSPPLPVSINPMARPLVPRLPQSLDTSTHLIAQVSQLNSNLLQLRERLRLLDANLATLGLVFNLHRPKKLTDAEVAALPVGEGCGEVCPICREEMQEGVVQLGCRHCFHRVCVGVWAQRRALCPICRVEIEGGNS